MRQGSAKPLARAGAASPARADRGRFFIYIYEERIGTIDFRLGAAGDYESTSKIRIAGQAIVRQVKVRAGPQGDWASIEIVSPYGRAVINRKDNTRVAALLYKGRTTSFRVVPNSILYDYDGPALLSRAVRQYDWRSGRTQRFPVLAVPGIATQIALEHVRQINARAARRVVTLDAFLATIFGVQATLWADPDRRICLFDVEYPRVSYVRAGFEWLPRFLPADPLLSKPEHGVSVHRNVRVPMRDGLKLATDLYRPGGPGPFPIILMRTPYCKEIEELYAMYYARRGYAVAVQDVRGRFSSPGVWEPFVNEGRDGADAIEWLATRRWSNGKVGMIGISYLAWSQWLAAAEQPPHLVTIVPNVSPPDPFYNIPYEHGVFFLSAAIWWLDVVGSNATRDISGIAIHTLSAKDYHKLLRGLPVIGLDQAVLGRKDKIWRKWLRHTSNDGYWRRASFLGRLAHVCLPVLHQSGWFDVDSIGAKLNYSTMKMHGHPHQKLIMGPWSHTDEAHRVCNGRDFGARALLDLRRTYLRWFDRWLKGIGNGIDTEPAVDLFILGLNDWVKGETYPLPGTEAQPWYLGKRGRLTRAIPHSAEPPDSYLYDPLDPTPDEPGLRRKDVLAYASSPFRKPYFFVGPISMVLYASSSAQDTDWHVRLIEVQPNGALFQLVHGKLRARFRESTTAPSLLHPGRIYAYRIDLWHIAIRMPVGSRLRVEIASAAFPTFSRNLNTGGHNETETRAVTATQKIYHGARFPSHVVLLDASKLFQKEEPKCAERTDI